MKSGISITLAIAVAAAATSAIAGVNGGGSYAKVSVDQPTLVVTGPVEAYDATHLTARILKQTVSLPKAITLIVGDSASVVGSIDANGVFVATTVSDLGVYVPGSSAVFLSGQIQKVNTSVGTVTVNGVTVDYTALLANGPLELSVGSKFTVSGTQPTLGGVVIPTGVNGGGVAAAGVNGGGMQAAGVNGGGMAAAGVIGGGFKPAGVNGGGMAAAGVNGGGMKAAGGNGGGMAAAGVNGGGIKPAGVNGGGMAAAGVNGGGMKADDVKRGGVAAAGVDGG